jgi:hypothetical protein
MQQDWQRIAEQAAAGFGFKSFGVVIAYDGKDEKTEQHARYWNKHSLAAVQHRNGTITPKPSTYRFILALSMTA